MSGIDPQNGTGGRLFHFSPPSALRKQYSATSPEKTPAVVSNNGLNLTGIVNIKAYDRMYTNEIPATSCNLLATQLDHLKVLICETEKKDHPRLTS